MDEELETVEWRLPDDVLQDLREFCESHSLPEGEVVRQAIQHFITERLLEEGE